jgi:chromosome segregation ATPase
VELKKGLAESATSLMTTSAELREAEAKLQHLLKGSSDTVAQREAATELLNLELVRAKKSMVILQKERDDGVAEVRELTKRERAAQTEKERMDEKLNRCEKRNTLLADEIAELKRDSAAAVSDDKEVTKLRRALAEFQKNSETVVVQRETLEQKNGALRAELDSAVRQLETAKTAQVTSEQKLEYAQRQLEKTQQQIKAYADGEVELEAAARDVARIKKTNTEFQKHNESLQNQVNELTKILKAQKGEDDVATDLKIENAAFRKQVDALKVEVHTLGAVQSDLEIAQAKMARLHDDARLKEQRREVMSDQVHQLTQQLDKLKRAHQEAQDALFKSEGEKTRFKTEIAQFQSRDSPKKTSKAEQDKSEGEIGFLNRQNERLLHQVSHVSYCMSHVSFCMSHVSYCMSHVSYCMSHVSFCMSHVSYCMSHVSLLQQVATLEASVMSPIYESHL